MRQRSEGALYGSAVALFALSYGCGSGNYEPGGSGLGQRTQTFINGEDDRLEFFELTDDRMRAGVEGSVVALTVDSLSDRIAAGDTDGVPTWAELDGLCADEPFADQPAMVFCSGVLVDWDLVLTSGHCVDVVPTSALRVVFDYYYRDEGDLAATPDSVYRVSEVITSQNDQLSPDRLDFAWLRLRDPARPPHRPAPIYTRAPGVDEGDAIINVGSGGGVPLKLDAGGHVQDSRPGSEDYFVADTDTSQGSSGSAAFDADLAVAGSLARGAPDFVDDIERGCRVTDRALDPEDAIEEFTYAHRAVQALCDTGSDSPLCNPECAEPCDAGNELPPRRASEDDGCSFTPTGRTPAGGLFVALSLLALVRRRQRSS